METQLLTPAVHFDDSLLAGLWDAGTKTHTDCFHGAIFSFPSQWRLKTETVNEATCWIDSVAVKKRTRSQPSLYKMHDTTCKILQSVPGPLGMRSCTGEQWNALLNIEAAPTLTSVPDKNVTKRDIFDLTFVRKGEQTWELMSDDAASLVHLSGSQEPPGCWTVDFVSSHRPHSLLLRPAHKMKVWRSVVEFYFAFCVQRESRCRRILIWLQFEGP